MKVHKMRAWICKENVVQQWSVCHTHSPY